MSRKTRARSTTTARHSKAMANHCMVRVDVFSGAGSLIRRFWYVASRRRPALLRLCWRMTLRIEWGSCRDLILPTRCRCQHRKVGATCLATRRLRQDGIDAYQVDRHGDEHVL